MGYYGHPELNERKETWSLLSMIQPPTDQPWCVIGDFKEILVQSEKSRGR